MMDILRVDYGSTAVGLFTLFVFLAAIIVVAMIKDDNDGNGDW